MDLRVYVDGVARIICDLNRTTTVHDIIIALAQYKGKAGRYSLIERAPNGIQRTLSPNEFTSDLISHPQWKYVLRENPSIRSKSVDGRKTPVVLQRKQSPFEMPSLTTISSSSSSDRSRTANPLHETLPTISSTKKVLRRPDVRQVFPSHSYHNLPEQHSSRSAIPLTTHQRSRSRSAFPSTLTENSAFQIVHHPHQKQYLALVNLLRSQEEQLQQQKDELNEKDQDIRSHELYLRQQDRFQTELKRLEDIDRRLTMENQFYSKEISPEQLQKQCDYHQELHQNYEHLQQQLTRCNASLEQNQQLHQQIQLNIEQTEREMKDLQSIVNNEKKDIAQYQQELDQSMLIYKKQQEEFEQFNSERHEQLQRLIEERQEKLIQLENQISDRCDSSYHFDSRDVLTPLHHQTLWKLCPSGIWV